MTDVRKRIVEAGYNALAENFLEWGSRVEGDPRDRFQRLFADNLPEGSSVLDLGCGAGVSTRPLADKFDVIGVDISETQLRLARRYVPDAHFVRADIAEVAFLEGRLDGIVALYSISHVPRAEHAEILRRFATWLRPDGLFLATLGVGDSPDWTGEWLGVQMFFSSHDEQTNRGLLQAAGLELMLAEVVEMREPEGTVSFLWALGASPRDSALRLPRRGGVMLATDGWTRAVVIVHEGLSEGGPNTTRTLRLQTFGPPWNGEGLGLPRPSALLFVRRGDRI